MADETQNVQSVAPQNDAPDFGGVTFGDATGNFNIDDIEVTDIINAVFVIDKSYSMHGVLGDMSKAYNEFVQEMGNSHVANNLFVSVVEFSEPQNILVRNGFQPINTLQDVDFGASGLGGSTALYDAVASAIDKAVAYREDQEDAGIDVKTLVFVITDGDDNSSRNPAHIVKQKIDALSAEERSAFSFTTILFGLGDEGDFTRAQQDMGIHHLAKMGNSAKDIRDMIGFISQSISSVSSGQGIPDIDF